MNRFGPPFYISLGWLVTLLVVGLCVAPKVVGIAVVTAVAFAGALLVLGLTICAFGTIGAYVVEWLEEVFGR